MIRLSHPVSCALLFLPLLFCVVFRPLLSPLLLFIIFIASIVSALFSLGLIIAPRGIKIPTNTVIPNDGLPQVPKTLAQLRSVMDHKEFEIFSAALIIAMGEGHRFYSRVGGAGGWRFNCRSPLSIL